MADTVRITNMPDSGSQERVALDLATMVIQRTNETIDTRKGILDLYAECLSATRKHGAYKLPS